MIFRKKSKPYKIGQSVIVIDFDIDACKDVVKKGTIIGKRRKLELANMIGISDAIEAFYEQNGFNSNTFNDAAGMRKEYMRAKDVARNLERRYYEIHGRCSI